MSISATGTAGSPATDLARLLNRPPDAVQRAATAYGEAHVFFPEAGDERCTAVLLVEADPAPSRKGRGGGPSGASDLARVRAGDDRPYVVSSRFAAALRTVFRAVITAADPADRALPLRIELPAVRVDGERGLGSGAGEGGRVALVRRLFEPLGWRVEAAAIPLDEEFPAWGESPYVRLALEAASARPADALRQLAVLLPALEGVTDQWVAPEGVGNLFSADADWLARHPERELIARRLDHHGPPGADGAGYGDGEPDSPAEGADGDGRTAAVEAGRAAVLAALREVGAARVVHLGCGRGELIDALLTDARFTELLGVDVSLRALSTAAHRLGLERTTEPAPEWAATRRTVRVGLVQGALMYADARLRGFDAAVLDADVVGRADPDRRPALEHAVFGTVRPAAVVVTSQAGDPGFGTWAERVAAEHGYTVTMAAPAGPALFRRGTPTLGGGESR
ncbi:3' terminal RNA ribose 2'-O-methyltransferase Hen1 [Kitasatospora sp. NPDC002965]|uniref:3' terminal RNA ribose 2'-O-methyltransferase Hen1 n=1 Tax=Kitasatospora sp. NPDC002965 TaxID=3154775 RepID=UPI0033A7C380